MNLHIQVKQLKKLGDRFDGVISYRNDEQFVDVSASKFSKAQLDKLYADAKKIDASWARGLVQRITAYRNIHAKPNGQKVRKLELFAEALKAYIAPAPNRWLFRDESDGYAVPFYVSSIKYHPSKRDEPASVAMSIVAMVRGSNKSSTVRFNREDLDKTVIEILQAKRYYLETPEAVQTYLGHIETYKKFSSLTGTQFSATGLAYGQGESISSFYEDQPMERDGVASTVVMDDIDDSEGSGYGKDEATCSGAFWGDEEDDDEEPDSDNETESDVEPIAIVKPVHPHVRVFDLRAHAYVLIHVHNLAPYVYDKDAAGKLVLDQDMKDLVTILVQGSSEVLEDIVRGKTGGTIVISTGPPGTGKTLTAEVFSEEIERPLYVVQCSQLGTDEEKVEKELAKVLARASRWKAILLIDEADVYVHARGTDLRQNAIVGVFLRVLEHYRGILFLTSNRETVIDDAILSRATAWLRYKMPNHDQLVALWGVLSAQYKIRLVEPIIADLADAFPSVSGRNIKNLLKLGTLLLRQKGREPNVALFQYVARFLDLGGDEKTAS
jgi:hypothetical protein